MFPLFKASNIIITDCLCCPTQELLKVLKLGLFNSFELFNKKIYIMIFKRKAPFEQSALAKCKMYSVYQFKIKILNLRGTLLVLLMNENEES